MSPRSDSRALGMLGKGLLALLALFVAFVIIATLVSIAISLVWAIVVTVVPVVVLGALAYLALSWYLDDSGTSMPNATAPSKPPEERLKERYVNGEIDEAEYERRLERYLDPIDGDSLGSRNRSRQHEFE